jgi:2-polyprenyl-6-methoxyphenol hydroxylase-like FAD-dependent oxidoreductase
MSSPHVAIAGCGPAGLLLGILLSDLGVRVTLLEKSSVADPWSSRSYSINLNPRGLSALDNAGVLPEAKAAGMARCQIVLEGADGATKKIPKNPPNYAFSRPDLVDCLEGILKEKHSERVTIRRGVGVAKVQEKEDAMEVSLDDGSKVTCTHVVGADGKWSNVRTSIPDWKDAFEVQDVPAFGVSISPCVTPERWEMDATSVFRPNNPKFYIIAAPLKGGQFSVSLVAFDAIKEDYPWLVPQGDNKDDMDWEAEYGTGSRATAEVEEKMSQMLKEELPKFYEDIQGAESLKTVRMNRRVSWLKPLVEKPSYCSKSGRVALIGDAAHAMTPSVGEGCNCALESAVSLVQSLSKDKPVTAEDLTQAFMDYGAKRPTEVVPIQERSAAANHYKKPGAAPKKA